MPRRHHGVTRNLTRALTALLVVSSVVIEWLFLTGAPISRSAVEAAVLPGMGRPAATQAAPVHYTRPGFQTGVVFTRWGNDAYSASDPNYAIGLNEIQNQTGARWIEMTYDLHQYAQSSTQVARASDSPTPEALAAGIEAAHAHGFKVFVEPLISLDTPDNGGTRWAGAIAFNDPAHDIPTWFTSYWAAIEPFMLAGQRAHADQMAIGTELQSLEEIAPSQYWYWLIAQARSVYSGRLTYDLNFTALPFAPQDWMSSPDLAALGVSLYTTISGPDTATTQANISELWAASAGKLLDTYAQKVNKPMFLSEIGYRNAADALSVPWAQTTTAPPDPQLQAEAYNAALVYIMSDPRFIGIYFWAWSLPPFSPNWLPAARVMKTWYRSPLA